MGAESMWQVFETKTEEECDIERKRERERTMAKRTRES